MNGEISETATFKPAHPVLRSIIEEICVGEEFALLRKTLELYCEIEEQSA